MMAQTTAMEETVLWQRYKLRGDLDAREQLILHHLDLVKYIAGRMAVRVPQSVSEDDLLGWGILGLLDAIEKFDLEQNIKFATYAAFRIRGAIVDEIRILAPNITGDPIFDFVRIRTIGDGLQRGLIVLLRPDSRN